MAINVRGIDVSGINNMKNSVENYKKKINSKINKIATIDQSVLRKAIKGTAATAEYNNMVARAKSQAKEYTKRLDQFVNALEDMKGKYTSSDQTSGRTSFNSIAK